MSQNNSNLMGDIKIESSLLKQAIQNDEKKAREAIVTMFKQFVPENEKIFFAQYLGIKGLWGVGIHSFSCLTERRVADISVAYFGEVTYQEGYLEFINSSAIYQPSKLPLYILFWGTTILALVTFVVSIIKLSTLPIELFFLAAIIITLVIFTVWLLILPIIVKSYYGVVKCGIVFWVREGIPIYIFASRKYLRKANALCRCVNAVRENRIKALKTD